MDLSSATMVARHHDPYSFHDSVMEDEDVEMAYRREYMDRNHDDSSREAAQQSGKSRRKQAQPNRVQHDTDHPVVRVEPESPEHRADELVKSYGDPVSCTICPDQFSSIESLREHHDLVHGQSSPVDSGYPTHYHRLGRELREKEEIREWPSDYIPEEGIPVDRRSGKKIFHQDAFCDLCDREFCNRYFLKTHLANKHGIYEEIPNQYHQSQINSLYPSYLQGPPSMVPLDRPASAEGRQSPLNMSLTPNSISNSPSKPSTPVSTQVPQLYGSKSPLSTEQTSPPKSPLAAPDGSIDSKDVKQRSLDDFCELCQKHFCNKYYLRKHKMDVHGIHSEPYSAKRRHSSNTMIGGFGANPAILPQNLPASMANIMLMNPFGPMFGMPPNPMFPLTHLPGQTPELPPHLKPPGSGRDAENSRSPGSQSEQVIKNPDAYCEICRKEFCDKYYLKVHKANMHNIQDDHSNSLPSFVPRISPQIDATNRDIVRDTQKMEMMKNLERRESEKYEAKYGNKTDRFEFDREKYEGRFEAEYQQRYLQAKHEAREERKEEKPMDFSSQEYHRRSPPCSMPSVPSSMPGIPSSMPIPSSLNNVPLSLSSNLTSSSVSNLTSHAPGIPTSLPSTPNFQTSTASMHPNHGLDIRPEHMQNHEPAPRKCDVCHKEFADKYALRIHRLNIHGLVHGQPTPPSMVSPEKKTPVKNERQTPPGYPTSPFNMPPNTPRSFGIDLPASSIFMTKPPGLPYPPSSTENPMSTMFSSMVTAKLADRVTCDICHKEVCNKYFLKTHKIKMHGCDPASVGKVMKPEQKIPKSTAVSPVINKEKYPELPRNPLLKPFTEDPITPAKAEELLRMGIDPEAYCEICKKEFCSKYFLRTHKLNMHGIPTDKPGNRKEDREISRREILEREVMVMRELGVYPSLYPGIPGMMGLPPPPVQSQYPFPPMPSMPMVRQMDEESVDSNQSNDSKSSKSKKEPANAIRVKCEICNKELCNRYFLRTHKLNKHGIVDDTLSEGQQRKLLELQQKGLLVENPMMIKDDGSIDFSEPRFIKREPNDMGALQTSRSPSSNGVFNSLDPNVMSNMSRSPFWNPNYTDDKSMDTEEANIFRTFTEVCPVCQRRFTSIDWLETHMAVEHNTKNEEDTERMRKKMALACQACGMVFPDKIGLQIHLVQEHGVGINLTDEPGNESSEKEQNNSQNADVDNNHISLKLKRKYSKILVRRKVHTCSKCDYRTLFMKNLHNHEERVHHIKTKRKFHCKNCLKRFRFEKSLIKHGRDCRQENVLKRDGQLICRLCSESFPDRRSCRLHILNRHTDHHRCSECGFQAENETRLSFHCRLKHGAKQRPALMPVNGHCNDEVNGESGKMPVCYSTPCDLKSQASFIMQPFTLRDENGFNHFVKAVVYLPVYQKINEPITVDFHLTPTDK